MNNKNNMVELNDEELDQIAGGAVYHNMNTNKIAFTVNGGMFACKNCTSRQVRDLCESLIGKYPNDAAYEDACVAALKEKGWI